MCPKFLEMKENYHKLEYSIFTGNTATVVRVAIRAAYTV
jgi:hypothetical protein